MWRLEVGASSFYRIERWPWGAGEVGHGAAVWSCEGAREGAREVGDV